MPRRKNNNGNRIDALIDGLGAEGLARVATEHRKRALDSVFAGGQIDTAESKRIGRRASMLEADRRRYQELLDMTEASQHTAMMAAPFAVALTVGAETARLGAIGWGALLDCIDALDAAVRPALEVNGAADPALAELSGLLDALDSLREVGAHQRAHLDAVATMSADNAGKIAEEALQRREQTRQCLGGVDPLPAILVEGLELAAHSVRQGKSVQETSVSCTEDVDGDVQ